MMTPHDVITRRQRYETLWSELKTERSSFDVAWRELGDYFDPTRPRFMLTDRNRGDRRNTKIIDNSGTIASRDLASGLHAGLTSPARPWLKLGTPDPGLNKFKPVQQWLFDVTERIHQLFHLSNLYTVLPALYGEMGIFGTSAMGVLDDPGGPGQASQLFRCYPYPIGSYVIGLDNRGQATTFMQEYTKTVAQVIEEFGGDRGRPLAPGDTPDWSNMSLTLRKLWDDGRKETPIDVCWIVQPNREYDSTRLGPMRFPWTSCHYEKGRSDAKGFLRESGFHEFPVLVPRWFVAQGDNYATNCPGMAAIGDVKQLQTMQKRKGQAIEKMVNPPIQGPQHLRTQAVSMLPGGMTFTDAREGQRGITPIHEVKPDLSHFVLDVQDVRGRIREAFFSDLFRMLSAMDDQRGAQPPTAREIDERHEEKMLMLGPVVMRTADDLLKPLVDRIFSMMARAGLLPPPPSDLHGVDIVPEFISVLAEAQKLTELPRVDGVVQRVVSLAAIDPGVTVHLDTRKVLEEYVEILSANPALLRDPEAVAAILQAQQQQQQAQVQAEQLAKLGAGAKALGSTPMGEDTALTRLLGVTG